MPDVTPYYGSAKGNGFPFCLERVNVADKGDGTPYDYWTTSGGYNKEDADADIEVTPEQISLSWQNAWRLYWMLYGVTGSGNNNGTPFTDDANAVDDLFDGRPGVVEKLCIKSGGTYGMVIGIEGTGTLVSNFYDEAGYIVRMYNGATSDEANFVGYGINSDIEFAFTLPLVVTDPPGIIYYFEIATTLVIYVCSYGDDPGAPGDSDFAYTTFQGIPVLCAALAESGGGAGSSQTADAVNLTSSATTSSAESYSIALDSIEFYNQ